jgi:hypothetical protein
MIAKKHKRKTIYLGWKNHGRIVARFGLVWIAYHVTLWEALCAREYFQYLSALSPLEPRIPLTTFFADFIRQNIWMVVFAAAFASIFLWDVLRLTHRIIGPLKRVENVLYAMIDGKSVRQIKFRKHDLVEDFEKAFNAYLASLPASNANADRIAAEREEGIQSPMPATPAQQRCERPSPKDDEQIAAILEDLRSIKGSADLIQVNSSAD